MTVPSTRGLARLLPQPPVVSTPLGAVAFSGVFGTWHTPPRPTTAWRLPGGGTLSRWNHRAVTLDLLVGPVPAEVPLWGAVWYAVAHRRLEVVDLTVALPGASGAMETGERLDALTVTEAGTRVTLGGPDAEALAAYAGSHLPGHWSAFDVAQTAPAALTWRLPALAVDEYARIGTTIAWSPSNDEVASWAAAAVPLETVLPALLGQ